MSGFPLSCTMDFAEERSEIIAARLLAQDEYSLRNNGVYDSSGVPQFDSLAGYLRSRTVEDLFSPENAGASGFPRDGGFLSTLLRMGITVDGVVIPKDILECLKSGEYNRVPLLIGNNAEESKFIVSLFGIGDDALYELVETFDPDHPKSSLPDFLDPLLVTLRPSYEPIVRLGQAVFQGYGVDNTARILSAYQDVYVYRFDWKDEPEPFDFLMGAGHALDLPFAFDNFITDHGSFTRFAWSDANKEGREAVSHAMMTYYAQFARSGNPNSPDDDLADWRPWRDDGENGGRMVFR
jgi:para-nitrobenzyl esterase